MSVGHNDSIVNVNENKPEDVVCDEMSIAIVFIRIELEDENGGVVDVHEQNELDLVSHYFIRCEHVSSVSSTKASHGGPCDTFLFDILFNRSVKLNQVEEVHGN